MKKSFSLLEVIFVILLISIISVIAFPKLFLNITNASYVKIQSDIALIRSSIIQNRNENIISGKGEAYIPFLDNAKVDTSGEKLFFGYENNVLLKYPVVSTSSSEKNSGKWIKSSNFHYAVFINSIEKIKFTYNPTQGTFNCDINEDLCKDLM